MWRVYVPKPVQKVLARVPVDDEQRLTAALNEMARDPFAGDVLKLAGVTYRRRVGAYRIIFDVTPAFRLVHIKDIFRRTTTTYRKR